MTDISRFKNIIFDLDGVLLDTEPLYTAATQQVIGPYGKVFDWSVKAGMMGRDALTSARHLVEQLELPISAEEYLQLKEPILLSLFVDSPEIPGAGRLVQGLAKGNRKLAVATSSSRKYYDLKTQKHDWFSCFDAVICGDQVERLKPAPDIFLAAARALGATPSDCLVFEDSQAGVEAALAAKMQVIAMPDPHLDRTSYPPVLAFIDDYEAVRMDD